MTERNDILIGAGRWKLTAENLLWTSDGRSWSGIAAEIRRHVPGEVPEMISDRTVVAFTLRGNAQAVIHRRGNGLRQAMPAATGAFWLCPEGVAEDEIRITGLVPEMLHIYLPRQPFRALSREQVIPISMRRRSPTMLAATTPGSRRLVAPSWLNSLRRPRRVVS